MKKVFFTLVACLCLLSSSEGMEKVTIASEQTKVSDNAYLGNINLEEVDFGSGSKIEKIGSNAFKGCINISKINNFPQSIKELGYNCFYACSLLTEINLPGSLERIYDNAFQSCHRLKVIVIPLVLRKSVIVYLRIVSM